MLSGSSQPRAGSRIVPFCRPRPTLLRSTSDQRFAFTFDALNFTMEHDDGQLPTDIEDADIVLIGISRTSKTPTSIYLANRGIKTANIPIRNLFIYRFV